MRKKAISLSHSSFCREAGDWQRSEGCRRRARPNISAISGQSARAKQGDQEAHAHGPEGERLPPRRQRGRIAREQCSDRPCGGAHRGDASGSSSTSAVTGRPGRNAPNLAASPSSRMRTGTRWTILVKLPVAFSGGMTLNWAPVAGATPATWPRTLARHRVRAHTRGHAGPHPGKLVLLKSCDGQADHHDGQSPPRAMARQSLARAGSAFRITLKNMLAHVWSRPVWPRPGRPDARPRRLRVRSSAAGPGTGANAPPAIGPPDTRSTTSGSAMAPVATSAICTLAPSVAPGQQCQQHGSEIAPARGQRVLVPRRPLAVASPLQQSRANEPAQPARQDVGRNAEALMELVEASQSVQGIAQDQDAPPLAHALQAAGDRALHVAEARALPEPAIGARRWTAGLRLRICRACTSGPGCSPC